MTVWLRILETAGPCVRDALVDFMAEPSRAKSNLPDSASFNHFHFQSHSPSPARIEREVTSAVVFPFLIRSQNKYYTAVSGKSPGLSFLSYLVRPCSHHGPSPPPLYKPVSSDVFFRFHVAVKIQENQKLRHFCDPWISGGLDRKLLTLLFRCSTSIWFPLGGRREADVVADATPGSSAAN